MIRKILRKFKFLHYLGFHNEDCERRMYDTTKDYMCIRTGNTHKRWTL
jgi:hypothetical protein